MSPLMFTISILVLVGVVLFIIGAIFKSKYILIFCTPCLILFFLWFVLASIKPDSKEAFCDLFGQENLQYVENIETFKPTLMDGYFISFTVSEDNFANKFIKILGTEKSIQHDFLRKQSLPNGWPEYLKAINKSYSLDIPDKFGEVLLFYDTTTKKAYVSILYQSW